MKTYYLLNIIFSIFLKSFIRGPFLYLIRHLYVFLKFLYPSLQRY